MNEQIKIASLEELLAASQATGEFKKAVAGLAEGHASDLIRHNPGAPEIKVLRVVMKILETWPELPIERVEVEGRAGCSDFIGRAAIQPVVKTVDFTWDCRWRARQEGWTDAFGDPDQVRAARTFGYQCFAQFEPGDDPR